jgi:hypothetical protein
MQRHNPFHFSGFHLPNFAFAAIMTVCCLASCKDLASKGDQVESASYTEILNIYKASSDGKTALKDSIIYHEDSKYVNGKKVSTTYFENDGTLKGVENQLYSADGNETGAEYKDKQGKLLSYYKYVTDNKGRKISSTGFDGNSDEVLRIEKYGYDQLGYLSIKDIFSADNTPQKRYTFRNDAQGQPLEMNIITPQGDTLGTESYQMTKFDDKKRWVEKWGFANGEPKTCYIRTFK